MPRQANGTYLAPANTAAVSGAAISSTAFNTLETDIGNEITNSLDRGGRSAMTAALPMGGQKITGMADPTVATDGATKNYVDTTTGAFFSTGDVKLTFWISAAPGWLLFDDGTFGSASSNASNRANNDTQNLFTLLYNNLSDANAPILTQGGGATTRAAQGTASAAWVANCRLTLPKALGRAIAIAGAGSGLTARALGATVGEENHTLAASEIPTITSANTGSIALSVTSTTSDFVKGPTSVATTGGSVGGLTSGGVTSTGTIAIGNAAVTSNNTSGGAHNTMQPTAFLNAMVKL